MPTHNLTSSIEASLPSDDMASRIASFDWTTSELGRPQQWPQGLRILLSMASECPAPMMLAWGKDLAFFPNDAAAELFGTHVTAQTGQPLRKAFAAVWSSLERMVRETLEGGRCCMRDIALDLARQGTPEESWWIITSSPLRGDEGEVCGLMWLIRETTSEVLHRRARDEASARLRRALAAGDEVGAWDWDVLNDRVTSESRFALFYSVDPELAEAGAPLEEYLKPVHPDDRKQVRACIDAAIRTGSPFYAEYRLVGHNSEVRWISATGQPEFDDQGRCVRLPGISFDITANRKR